MAILLAAGCALVPQPNSRLEEARALHEAALRDASVARHATIELSRASEMFQRADTAWSTLQDPALVDHLAYLAKQRLAIAREVARKALAEDQVVSSR